MKGRDDLTSLRLESWRLSKPSLPVALLRLRRGRP